MNVFLSWSGARSRAAAQAFHEWLPFVINAVEPWISAADIDAGARWGNDVQKQLEEAKVGVLFVTSENLNSPWLLFEAGALAKTLEGTFVCPHLLDFGPAELPQGPLAQFQATEANEEGTWKLLLSINRALKDESLAEERLRVSFRKWWVDLKGKLNSLPSNEVSVHAPRDLRDIAEEILHLVRRMDRAHADESALRSTLRLLGCEDQLLEKRVEEMLHSAGDARRETGERAEFGSKASVVDIWKLLQKSEQRKRKLSTSGREDNKELPGVSGGESPPESE